MLKVSFLDIYSEYYSSINKLYLKVRARSLFYLIFSNVFVLSFARRADLSQGLGRDTFNYFVVHQKAPCGFFCYMLLRYMSNA